MKGKNNFYKIFFDDNDVEFIENKFLCAKFEQQPSRGKAYEICNSWPLSQHIAKNLFYDMNSWTLIWAWFLDNS